MPRQCPPCNDAVAKEADRRERLRRDAQLARYFAESGLPRCYVSGKRGPEALDLGPDTDGYRVARMLTARMLTGKAEKPWLWLWSAEAGTFKTTLACVTLVEAIRSGIPARFANVSQLFEDVRATYATDDRSEADVLGPIRSAGWLVLDDIGVEGVSRNKAEILYRITDARFSLDIDAEPGRRGVIYTSNGPLRAFIASHAEQLSETMAARLERRLTEITEEVQVTA